MKDETLNPQQENQNNPANNDNERKPYLSEGNEDKQNTTNDLPSQQRSYNNPYYQQRDPNQQQRPYNPNYQQRDPNQQRPYNPNYQQRDPNQQQRPYNPNYQQRDPNQQRPYNPNYQQRDPNQQQRPYNPNYQQRDPNQQQRPYNPNYQQRDPNQQQRPYNPNYQQRDPNQQQRPYNPNYQQRDPNQQQRPYNPNYQQRDPNQQQRPYNPNYQQRDPNQQQRPYNPNYQQRNNNNNNRFGGTGGGYNRQQQGGGYNQNGYGNNRNRPQQQRNNNTRNQYFQPANIAPPNYQEDTPTNIRLNRFIASAGICSRRKADELIKNGEITVNGTPITEMGYKITPQDVVAYKDKNINPEKKVYILLNKPKNTITTTDDPKERPTVMSLIKNAYIDTTRLYPIGRLDRNTTGLLLLTNDGDLAQNLSHPSREVLKVYQATLDKPLTKVDFDTIANGLELEDGFIQVDAIAYPDLNDKTQVGIEIHSGRNRIVRRIFEHLGYKVKKLDRTAYASLNKRNIPRSKWRYLTVLEVLELKNYDYDKQKTEKQKYTNTPITNTPPPPPTNYRRPTSTFIDDNDAELL